MSGSLYDVLGVARDASPSEIKKAFFKKSRVMHPDKWADSEPSVIEQKTKEFQALTEAHEELKDPERRKEYDRTGKTGAHPSPSRAAARTMCVCAHAHARMRRLAKQCAACAPMRSHAL
jgi:DnaJ-class molecular chaperone